MFSTGLQKVKLSKTFHDICVKIGECKSREEEEQIVNQWMASVKGVLDKSKIGLSDLYENVISLIHLTLLGYNTSFGHIHAVNLTQDSQIMTKALGYLACSALFDSKSNLLILIINSTQRDLSSQQPINMALALTAITHLVTPDLIPPILGYISQCLTHSVPMIRQKAVMAVHSFIKKDPSCVVEFFPELCRLLLDPDLSIVNAVVNTFSTLLSSTLNIRQICDVLPDITRVVEVIQSGNVRHEYYHQRVMAPFILVNIFSLFQSMAPHMPELAEKAGPILSSALQNGTLECTASASVLYEAIRACVALGLRDLPQLKGAISLFMSSRDQNYKFIGLGLLQSLPDFADEFQSTVIDCLEHPDPSIRLRTLGLLHAMANDSNAQVIVINMLKFFQRTKNDAIRSELADRITSIASKFAPSPLWFAKTMEQLFALGGELIRPEVGFAVMKLIDEQCDDEMKKSIVNLYIDVAQSGVRLSDIFVTVIAKVISKYGNLSDEYDMDFIALLLCDLADLYENSRAWVLNALIFVVSKLKEIPQQALNVFENYKQSRKIEVQEICFEALALMSFKDSLVATTADDGIVDEQLSFLDTFVQDAVDKGGRKYIPLEERDADVLVSKPTLRFSAYQAEVPQVYSASGVETPKTEAPPEEEFGGLNTAGVRCVWGDGGLNEAPATDVQAPTGIAPAAPTETAPVSEPEPAKPSLFQQLALTNKAQKEKDAQKEKMAASLFGKQKPSLRKKSIEPAKVSAPSTPVVAVSVSPEDAQLLQSVANECSAQPPEAMTKLSSAVSGIPVYQDNQMKVAAFVKDGTILLAVMNSGAGPMMNLNISIEGPDSLNKETLTHPSNLVAIPAGCAVSMLASYKFPTQMKGFPEFKFRGVVAYNKGARAQFDLPMNLATFISPFQATTPQFGALWKQGGSEIVYNPPKSDITLDAICAKLRSDVHVGTVQRIGTEEILIGNLVSTPFKVLIHVKFGAVKVEMKVLTRAQPLTQSTVALLKSIFG